MLFNRKPQPHSGQWPAPPRVVDQVLAARDPSRERTYSLIDVSLTIIGDLRSEGDVQVDGHICGNIRCAQLIVGKDATITGTITAEQVVVRGRITGTIRAPFVILQDTAQVECEIAYNVLAVDAGASFEGAARRRADPLQDEDAVSSLAELREIMPRPGAETVGGALEASRPQITSEAEEQPPLARSSPSETAV